MTTTLTEQDRVLLKTLVALAWADGELSEGETQWLDKVFDQLHLVPNERERLLSVPQALPSAEEYRSVLTSQEDRHFLLRVLLTMALSDGTVSLDEQNMLADVAARLDVSPEQLEQLRTHTLA